MLGGSGCAVSSLALGTMTFGAEADEAVAHRQLDRFIEAGGTLVDTADVYAGGRSEEIIGRWFASRPSDVTEPVVLATKGRSDASLLRRLEATTARNRELAEDNQRLRRQLAQALGQLRAAGIRPDPDQPPNDQGKAVLR